MAVNLQSTFKYKSASAASPMHFQRKKHKAPGIKIRRKIRMRIKHYFLFFLIVTGFFLALQQIAFFLLSWEKLKIKDVSIISANPSIKQAVEKHYASAQLGNILLLDISKVQESIEAMTRVKEVRVRRIFPSALRIEIIERVPGAIIMKETPYLIDREGVLLDKYSGSGFSDLPVLVDRNQFKDNIQEKLDFAWTCIDNLTPAQKQRVEMINLTEYGNIKIRMRGTSTLIILGNDRFSEKINFYESNKMKLTHFGALEYVDLRLEDRITIKPQHPFPLANDQIPHKEES